MSEHVKAKIEKLRVNQGDIFKDIDYLEKTEIKDGNIKISLIEFPLVMVLTQDCDLEQDYNNKARNKNINEEEIDGDKYLLSVIVVPIYNADLFFSGQHLSELNYKMQDLNSQSSTKKDLLKRNEIPRYYYLNFVGEVPIPNSIIDFKHYFTVNVEDLYKKKEANYVCSIEPLFREKISHRFSNYLSRIGLPEM